MSALGVRREKAAFSSGCKVVLRSLFAGAVKGNGPAQRTVIEAVQAVEGELVAQAVTESAQANTPPMTDIEAVRRIAFVFAMAERERKKKNEPEK